MPAPKFWYWVPEHNEGGDAVVMVVTGGWGIIVTVTSRVAVHPPVERENT